MNYIVDIAVKKGFKEQIFNDLIKTVALAADLDEGEQLYHGWRVGLLAYHVADALGWSDSRKGNIYHAGLLHDVGGVGQRFHMVHQAGAEHPGPEAQNHVRTGVRLLGSVPVLKHLIPAVEDHHEQFDGKGYPMGKKGADILPESGVLHLCDIIDVVMRNLSKSERVAKLETLLESSAFTICSSDITDGAKDVFADNPELLNILYNDDLLKDNIKKINFNPDFLKSLTPAQTASQLFWLLAQIIDTKHPYTAGHSLRVAHYCALIAESIGQKEINRWDALWSGLLHDMGKLGTPRYLLEKPTALSGEERKIIRQHPVWTKGIIESIDSMKHLAAAATSHHENYDGSGYPSGLEGEKIPVIGRILAFADAYDAMTTDKSYRVSISHTGAIARIRDGVGIRFDPHIAESAIETLELHGAAAGALPSTIEEFHEYLKTETFGSWSGGSDGIDRSPTKKWSGRGALLLKSEAWQRVVIDDKYFIVSGRNALENTVKIVSSNNFIDFIDDDSTVEFRLTIQNLSDNIPATEYVYTPSGTPLEILVQKRNEVYEILFRTAFNQLQSLKRLALFYRNFMSTSDAVCFVDEKLRVSDVNRAFLDLFSFTLKDVVDKKPSELLIDANTKKSEFTGPIDKKSVSRWSGEMALLTGKGKVVDVSVATTVISDANGNTAGFVIQSRDIGAAKRSAARMKALNSSLLNLGMDYSYNVNMILKTAGEGLDAVHVRYMRFESGKEQSVFIWNKDEPVNISEETCSILKQKVLSLPDNKFPVMRTPEYGTVISALVSRSSNNLGILHCAFLNSGNLIDEERDFLGSLASALANEEIRRASELSLTAAIGRLEKIHRQKSDIMAITTHDLKSPLAAMIGYADLMISKLDRIDTAKTLHYLNRISNAGSKMVNLIDSILDLERFETGRIILSKESTLIDVVLEECVDLNRVAARDKNITINFSKPRENIEMRVDVIRLEQVFNNILSNAVKFTPASEIIDVAIEVDRAGFVQIVIKDRGPGIPEDALEYIFDRYAQVHDNSAAYKGAGLGLNIVRHIVKAHGGRVWADNRNGGGSKFIVEFKKDSERNRQSTL